MTYSPTVWIDDNEPDIDAVHLNKMETGIKDAHDGIDSAVTDAAAAQTSAAAASASVTAHSARVDNPHAVTARQAGARHHKNAVKEGALGNDSFDNSLVLQGLLDALRNAGGGELYLPFDPANGHTIYRTKTLHVYSNTRIVTEGATLKATNYGDPRAGVVGDWSYPYGLLSLRAQPNVGYSAKPSGITIEGLVLDTNTAAIGTDGIRGIFCYADDVRIKDVSVLAAGRPEDCIEIGGSATRVWIERSKLNGARRNNISIVEAKYVWVSDCEITACEGTAIGGNASPGCGIEVETDGLSAPTSHIYISDNDIRSNAGAGVALVMDHNGAPTEANDFLVEGNTIVGNGAVSLPFGTKGGVFVRRGQADGLSVVRVIGNVIRNQVRGAGVQGYDAAVENVTAAVIVMGNNLRGNAGGTITIPYLTGTLVNTGNIT